MQRYLVTIILTLLFSCSTTQQPAEVSIAKDIALKLQSVDEEVKYYQQALLTVTMQEQQHNMLVNTEYTQGKLAIVAVSLQGMPLFELTHDDFGYVDIKRYIPLDIEPAHILADMQLIQIPVNKLSSRLIGGRIEEVQNAENRVRTLYFHQQPVIEVTYFDSVIEFHHLQRQYKMTIKKLKAH